MSPNKKSQNGNNALVTQCAPQVFTIYFYCIPYKQIIKTNPKNSGINPPHFYVEPKEPILETSPNTTSNWRHAKKITNDPPAVANPRSARIEFVHKSNEFTPSATAAPLHFPGLI